MNAVEKDGRMVGSS
jgi:hypothetical protein